MREASGVDPLLLTGPPAAGKSTTAHAVVKLRQRAAVIDVDDIRHLVISGHAAPWDGEEGRLQQRVGVENACDLAQRLCSIGIDVVLADVVDAETLGIYRRRLPNLVVVRLDLSLTAARSRAASRLVYLSDQEFEDLHAAATQEDLRADAVVRVEDMQPDEQALAVTQVWLSINKASPR